MECWSYGVMHPPPQHSISPFLHRNRRAAFTLIEILVVVVIMLLAAGVALPSFMRSMQGQRLRTSARSVATSHKYARNMAVLRQQPMAVLFDRLNGEIDVVQLESRQSLSSRDMFLDTRSEGARVVSGADGEEKDEAEAVAPSISISESRPLERGVKISDFSSEGDVVSREGVYWVNYYPSGMSDGFKLELEDERGRKVEIQADALSGGIEVEYE
jgi:prepilin-type N-terminal cleavage/methylation domain-containing protein